MGTDANGDVEVEIPCGGFTDQRMFWVGKMWEFGEGALLLLVGLLARSGWL